MTVGIVGYGAYVPKHRIKVEEIAKVWGADAPSYKRGLELREKSVPAPDQDVITMSVEAARNALLRCEVDPSDIGAIYIGSESHPYAVKPSGTTVAEALGAVPAVHVADLEFACKAGSEGMFIAFGLVKAGLIKYGLAIGADTSQGAPGDALEYSAAAGAAAFIMGADNVLATIDHTFSFTTDTPDFWRREYMHYPQHAGRYTGEPAYMRTTIGSTKGILDLSGMKPEDFDYAVFHQPNGKFPMRVGKKLGFTREQILTGWLVPVLGNTYSGASPLGLSAVLDVAKPGDRILMCSYGSGAGSDSFILTVTEKILEAQDRAVKTRYMLDHEPIYLEYGAYAKFRRKIRKAE
ncbi:MAG: hydroxymethylglutaryl-CoA synthase [Proteobacteria bacterium]|jgi:hydroxymethylglutaryl-CoA synthase|nr:hydroxymethylglutaryl-CoA synthase [Pseudomonadota bacterium]